MIEKIDAFSQYVFVCKCGKYIFLDAVSAWNIDPLHCLECGSLWKENHVCKVPTFIVPFEPFRPLEMLEFTPEVAEKLSHLTMIHEIYH